MFRDFAWKFWVIGILLAVIVGIPIALQAPIQLGLDLQGGTMLTYHLDAEPDQFGIVLQVVQNRVDSLGMRSLVIRQEGPQEFVVQVPGVDAGEIGRIKRLIETSGHLEFMIVEPDQDQARIKEIFQRKQDETFDPETAEFDIALRWVPVPEGAPPGTKAEVPPADDPASYTLLRRGDEVLDGRLLSDAFATVGDLLEPAVGFSWGPEGARKFGDVTEAHEQKNLAIVLDGVIKSQPVIQERIGATGRITGNFTQQEVNDLIVILKGGSLPSQPKPISDLTVGPGLGLDSIERGKVAVWLSLALVIIFTIGYYRAPGVVATLALLINLALLLCILILFEATLTLPGIAGIVLTVGMAIDANILIFERIREEKDKGMGIRQAVENGYGRAFWTIFDANLTTLITALILYQVGTGPIKGFAVTLSVGIITSLFCALFVTKAIFALLFVKGWMSEFSMMRLVKETKIPFLSYRMKAIPISVLVIVAGMVVFYVRGEEKYGVEFTGGAVYQMVLKSPTTVADVRDRIDGIENPDDPANPNPFRGSEVQSVSLGALGAGEAAAGATDSVHEFQIRVRMVRAEGDDLDPTILQPLLEKEFGADLAPLPFPELPPRDAIIKERPDSTQGKVAVLVRLDPRVREVRGIAEAAAALGASDPDLAGVEVTAAPDDEGVKAVRVVTGLLELDPPTKANAAREKITAFFKKSTTLKISEPMPRVEEIGSSVAYNLKSKAILAMAFAIVAIVLYITFRFEFKFGLAAIVALVHDVLIALGIVAVVDATGLVDLKIDLAMVTAFLTIIGYSLNDTIVVFDRIRESLGSRQKLEYADLIDRSINQTLGRTILTSATTLVALLALFFAGVNVIRDFSFAMVIGVVVGTYSSIFIASPTLLWLRNREVAAEEKAPVAAK